MDISYTTMEGAKESLQLRIDVSLDQDKDENPNQDQEIVYSQSAENADVDVVNLESDCPPSSSSSSSSSDGTMSGPEHVEIVNPNNPPNLLARGSPIYHLQRDATISSIVSAHQSQTESIPTSLPTNGTDKTSGKRLNPSDGMNTGKSWFR